MDGAVNDNAVVVPFRRPSKRRLPFIGELRRKPTTWQNRLDHWSVPQATNKPGLNPNHSADWERGREYAIAFLQRMRSPTNGELYLLHDIVIDMIDKGDAYARSVRGGFFLQISEAIALAAGVLAGSDLRNLRREGTDA